MAHFITQGSHPDIVILRIYGELQPEDLFVDDKLGLNERQRYVLIDISQMEPGLPPDFISGARKSFFVNDNLIHASLYLRSPILKQVAMMVAKLTRRRHKLSIYETWETAMNHLLRMVEYTEVA